MPPKKLKANPNPSPTKNCSVVKLSEHWEIRPTILYYEYIICKSVLCKSLFFD